MNTCLLLYIICFMLYIFECYFMILKCKYMEAQSYETTKIYLLYGFVFTTIINLLVLGIIIIINKSPVFENYFIILGCIGMFSALCCIVIYLYNSKKTENPVSLSALSEDMFRSLKCVVLGYVTFSSSYDLLITAVKFHEIWTIKRFQF